MQQPGQPPVYVLNQSAKRERGEVARMNNIRASKTVADIIRTTLGPRSMLKMILDPMGGIVMTNDGNAILREIDVSHPAAKAMIELSRAQDDQIGDGTTSVIILAGEVIAMAEPLLSAHLHPINITLGYNKALEYALEIAKGLSFKVDPTDADTCISIIKGTLNTKFVNRWSDLMCQLAYKAVSIVARNLAMGAQDIDIKRLARVEKIPGATMDDCCVIDGCVIAKDVVHPQMPKRIENPRVVLLDCPLEYKKAQSMLNVELMEADGLTKLLEVEEAFIRAQVEAIMKHEPTLIVCEKGVADLAAHMFVEKGVTVLRRCRKTDNIRLAHVTGAHIVHRPEEIRPEDIGTNAGLFELKKMGDTFFSFVHQAPKARACTILLRGANKDTLMEVERNLQDAMHVARNVMLDPRMVPGGGAFEMELAQRLRGRSGELVGQEKKAYMAVAQAMEVIPRTLLQNCGAKVIRRITELRAVHAGTEGAEMGVDGETGELVNTREIGIWDPLTTKVQVVKTAIESACMLLRVDDLIQSKSHQ
eukprot:gnl/Dysnectes_brevis/346_a381_5155.p1 GENE.gnl/Dysnectes_brevis/346_a381_5155~~gnl/Dysnectes_brevis/346_a381_5155.p1  ORF type:complete len:533 (-),score=241.88 gnl/Dysnectes_brevis/346_a381_5155:86-1684(-)